MYSVKKLNTDMKLLKTNMYPKVHIAADVSLENADSMRLPKVEGHKYVAGSLRQKDRANFRKKCFLT